MTDKEILDKYIDLDKSCLTEKEKRGVMEMLYKYKEAFIDIGTCPNIEVKIDMTERFPFFIRPYHVKEEDKALEKVTIFVKLIFSRTEPHIVAEDKLLPGTNHSFLKSEENVKLHTCIYTKSVSKIYVSIIFYFNIWLL